MNNLSYLLALHSVDGLGPIRLKKILEYFEDPKEVWMAKSSDLKNFGVPSSVIEKLEQTRKKLDPEKYLAEINKAGIKFLTVFDDSYPTLLNQIYDPPVVIYFRGTILPQDNLALGVVGTRKITGYGQEVTSSFTKSLSQRGFTIVSGLARGVDTVAHRSAIDAAGRTIAVLGGGLNKIFPPENISLVKKIISGYGAVISEFPPDYPSLAGNFPSRNRIIAGLSKGVLVTEAAEDSGSLITARVALEEGREVFAVPGPVTSQLSKGPADLIKEGARLVYSVEDILETFGLDSVKIAPSSQLNNLTEIEELVLKSLENETKHIDDLIRQLNKSSAEVNAALVKMEILGFVKNLGGGNYIKVV